MQVVGEDLGLAQGEVLLKALLQEPGSVFAGFLADREEAGQADADALETVELQKADHVGDQLEDRLAPLGRDLLADQPEVVKETRLGYADVEPLQEEVHLGLRDLAFIPRGTRHFLQVKALEQDLEEGLFPLGTQFGHKLGSLKGEGKEEYREDVVFEGFAGLLLEEVGD